MEKADLTNVSTKILFFMPHGQQCILQNFFNKKYYKKINENKPKNHTKNRHSIGWVQGKECPYIYIYIYVL